ncbi:hypothetical protein NCCP691_40820 [Noviherbaspirillum aridicola]|uniref:WGR domain-containing protein n=1 Tax=Noviherbaspirillum aridicola TaxID=2849687 RepID=A0ABQ4QA34_9BURK|nr:hypothetical protein NCCP691_40820 [Noviherbaspirillum aridicola]
MIDPADSATTPLPQPTRMRFASDTRVYSVVLDQDLLGDWTVVQSWGGKDSRRGGGKITHVPNFEDAMRLLEAITRRRAQHGYKIL